MCKSTRGERVSYVDSGEKFLNCSSGTERKTRPEAGRGKRAPGGVFLTGIMKLTKKEKKKERMGSSEFKSCLCHQ